MTVQVTPLPDDGALLGGAERHEARDLVDAIRGEQVEVDTARSFVGAGVDPLERVARG